LNVALSQVALSQKFVLLSSLLSFRVYPISKNRNFSSKNYLNEPNLFSPESKDSVKNKNNKVGFNNTTTSHFKNTDNLNVKYNLDSSNCGIFSRFYLRIKNIFRRIIIGVKKGISTPIFSPKLFNLLLHPLIKKFRYFGLKI
jgi:hypothetical protein